MSDGANIIWTDTFGSGGRREQMFERRRRLGGNEAGETWGNEEWGESTLQQVNS